MSTSPRSGYGILSAESLQASELLPLIDDMTLDEQIIVVGKLRAIEIVLLERIMHLDQWHPHHRILSTDRAILTAVTERPNGDELLDAKEAARRMGYSPRWLYKNANLLPFTIRQKSGRLRFSKHGLDNYLRNHPKKF